MKKPLRRLEDHAQAELLSILETTRDLVIRYDRDIRVQFFNSAADRVYKDLLGVSLRVGLCTYDLFPPEQRPYWDGINARVLGGEAFTEELGLTDVGGTKRIYEIDYHPTRRGAEVLGFTTFAREVTQARAHEVALREKHKLESIGVLAGGIAHDFNNLLAIIAGNIELAIRDSGPTAPARAFLCAAREATLRATDLTRQMLTYAGRAPAQVQPVDMVALVKDMLSLLRASTPKNITLAFESDREAAWVCGDSAQLQQVVMNLVANAADAVGGAAGTVCVRVGHERRERRTPTIGALTLEAGQYVVLVVEDNGCGIPDELRTRIFDPFFTTKRGGRGLGLSAILGILRNHRAGIELHSQLSVGTTFRVLFPEGIAADTAETIASAPSRRHSGTVLVADDERAILTLSSTILQRLGFEVITVDNGLDAVEKARPVLGRLRFAILDLNMPGHDGRKVAALLRAERADLPVVLSSGFADIDVADALEEPRTYFMGKPFSVADVERMVARALGL